MFIYYTIGGMKWENLQNNLIWTCHEHLALLLFAVFGLSHKYTYLIYDIPNLRRCRQSLFIFARLFQPL